MSRFLIQIDAIFNTNKLNMPLSILVSITNTMLSFPITYIFIFSESAKAFKFSNTYYKKLFFWNNCLGPVIILRDFLLGLFVAIIKKAEISMVEADMN